jgi:putative transcriptional regulator
MRKTKSAILEAVHETAKGLHAADVMKQVTLRGRSVRSAPLEPR